LALLLPVLLPEHPLRAAQVRLALFSLRLAEVAHLLAALELVAMALVVI
jgi:hypothetical protein